MITRAWLVAAAFLLAGVTAAPAQITEEAALSGRQYGPAPGDQSAPVVATDGLDFLVAWIDARAIPVAIYANRVSRDGRVLDGTGIRIPLEATAANDRLIGAFYVDGAYTIVYSYESFASASFHTDAATISGDGRLIDGPRTILDDAYVSAGATNGSRIVLVAGNNLVVLNGRSEIVGRFAISAVPPYGSGIGSNGSTFLVGTFTYDGASNSVNLIALDANGKPTDETRIAASASGDGPLIGSDGSDYVVLYFDVRTSKPVAQYVDAHAQIRSTTVLDGVTDSVARGALVWTGRFYLLTATAMFNQPMEVFRLDRAATAVTPMRLLGDGTPGTVNQSATAWNGTSVLMTWTSGSQQAPDGFEVVGTLANADATSISPLITIPSAGNLQVTPVIATSGSQDLAVWAEPSGIYATRITPDGRALDGRGITVSLQTLASRSLSLGEVPTLRAIYDGSSYLVAWGSYTGVTAQRIDPTTGSLVGPPFELAQCTRSFDLVKDNESPVLFNAGCSEGRVYAQRVGATGPVGAPVAISPPDMFANAPHAVWNGNQWLAVWHKLVPLPLLVSPPVYRATAVYAARISTALALLDVQPILIAESDFNEGGPVVASDGHEFLVVWSHVAYNATDGLYLRRVQTDGSESEAEFLVPGSFIAAQGIVWSGARYTIGYSRMDGYWNDDLFLTHVSFRKDEPLIHDEVTISATPIDERYISLAAPPGRPLRVVYTRVATEPQYGGVSRVFMRDEITALRRRSVRLR